MIVGVCSDVHGRVDRLEAFITEARGRGAEELWCLGDVVDALIGADPRRLGEAVALAERECDVVLGGNHELWSLRNRSLGSRAALTISGWRPMSERHGVLLTHASVRDPFMEFVQTAEQAHRVLAHAPDWLALHGHTHTRRLWASTGVEPWAEPRPTRGLQQAGVGERWLACPGALVIGRPSFLMVDLEAHTLEWVGLKS